MRIGIDCYAMQHPSSAERGIGRYARDLTRALLDAAPADEFTLYLVDDLPEDATPVASNVRLRRIRGCSRGAITSPALDIHLSGRNPDELDALLLLSPLQSLVGIRMEPGLAVASVFYDLIPETNPALYLASDRYREAYERYLTALRWYDAVLTMSRHAAADLAGRRRFPREKLHVIGAAANPTFTPPDDCGASLAEDIALVQSLGVYRPYILNVGHEDPRKGSRTLLEAFASLAESYRSTHQLVFAYNASESHKAELLALASDRGIPHAIGDPELLCDLGVINGVVFTGWCDERKLRALYRLARVMAFPSAYEGFGLPLLEAMACGCPVIAGDNSSQPEVVGEAGLLVRADDVPGLTYRLEGVLHDQELGERMRCLGLEQAARFRWQDVAARALAAIKGDPV